MEQVAEELSVGLPTIRMLLKTGELRGIQVGRRGLWRIAQAGHTGIRESCATAFSKGRHEGGK